jgi:hypothetical protein
LYYAVPFSAASVLVIDPKALKVRLIGGLPEGPGKWSCGAKLTDGTICCVPYNAAEVLLIHPATKSIQLVGKGPWGARSTRRPTCPVT